MRRRASPRLTSRGDAPEGGPEARGTLADDPDLGRSGPLEEHDLVLDEPVTGVARRVGQ